MHTYIISAAVGENRPIQKGSRTMKNVIKESKPQVEPHVITSQNSPELAQRIRQASADILKRNYNLYKELENK